LAFRILSDSGSSCEAVPARASAGGDTEPRAPVSVSLITPVASIWAADLSEPGLWRKAEEILGLAEAPEGAPIEDAWSAWTTFCERSEPVDVLDYRTLLDERYPG
jgi:hypothetical protein